MELKKKIMIVEDEAVSAMALSMVLNKLGYNICGLAGSGEEAVQKVKEENPDIVLMDINLPGNMDGIDAAIEIRSLFGTPIIFITGYPDEKIRQRAQAAYPSAYLFKPVESAEIKSAIESALKESKKKERR